MLSLEVEPIMIGVYLVDPTTGEVLNILTPTQTFQVNSEHTCNWVMDKMLDADSQIKAIKNSEEVIKAQAIIANADKMLNLAQKRLNYLHYRFDAELGEYARQQLEGQKGKTLNTLLGSIALRIKKGGVRVADEEKALTWARDHAPEAIKTTEKFLISVAPVDKIAAGLEQGIFTDAFRIEPDTETVKVTTGVEA